MMQEHLGESAPNVEEFEIPDLFLEDIGEDIYVEIATEMASDVDDENGDILG
jgi:hypothetical protein